MSLNPENEISNRLLACYRISATGETTEALFFFDGHALAQGEFATVEAACADRFFERVYGDGLAE